jgi:hypothetical protein
MADLSDVEIAVASYVTAAVYPQGVQAPAAIGAVCRIYRGWPIPAGLNADLAAGIVNVTISPDTGMGRTTTRYAPVWSGTAEVPTISATVQDTSVTVNGTVCTGIAVGLIIDQKTYAYRPQAQDSLQTIAAALATEIQVDRIAFLSGARISVPGANTIIARVIADSTSSQEIRRQQREIRVVSWSPTPTLRDITSSTIDEVLTGQSFINLSDGTQARLSYNGTQVFDQSQNALLYRRDLIYTTEYPTMISVTGAGMLFGSLMINTDTLTV